MTPPHDAEQGVLYRVAEYSAAIMGAMGVVLMAVAGVWWVYQSIQRGMAPMELGELGGSLVLIAIFVKVSLEVLTRDREDDGAELEGVFDSE